MIQFQFHIDKVYSYSVDTVMQFIQLQFYTNNASRETQHCALVSLKSKKYISIQKSTFSIMTALMTALYHTFEISNIFAFFLKKWLVQLKFKFFVFTILKIGQILTKNGQKYVFFGLEWLNIEFIGRFLSNYVLIFPNFMFKVISRYS